jgi:hypothetical protein
MPVSENPLQLPDLQEEAHQEERQLFEITQNDQLNHSYFQHIKQAYNF